MGRERSRRRGALRRARRTRGSAWRRTREIGDGRHHRALRARARIPRVAAIRRTLKTRTFAMKLLPIRFLLSFFIVPALIIGWALPAAGQGVSGDLSGVVVSQDGLRLPGATVVVR